MSGSSEERRQRKHDRHKQELLAAASRLFAEQGYNSVTVRRIADEAGCSQGTLYLYFADKSDILRHLCAETFERLTEELDAVEAKAAPGEETLLEASRVFCAFCLANPHHFKVFLMASTDFGDAKAVDFIGAMGLASFERLRRLYEAAAYPVEAAYGSIIWWNGLKGIIDFINLHREKPWFRPERLIALSLATQVAGHRAGTPASV